MKDLDKFRDDSEVIEMYDHDTEMKRIYEAEKHNAVKEAIDENTKEVSLNSKKEIASNMLKKKMKIEDISEITGLSIDEINNL